MPFPVLVNNVPVFGWLDVEEFQSSVFIWFLQSPLCVIGEMIDPCNMF